MVTEPTYPEDAPVSKPGAEPASTNKAEEAPSDSESSSEPRRSRKIVAGAAIGIGSAAVVAALLYANRSRGKGDRNK